MKVWFGTTTREFEKYRDYYFSIRDYIVERGHVVLFDWLEDADTAKHNKPTIKRNIKNIYHDVVSAINECDISIIEFTVPNFSSSHQINYSLYKRKPTLVMRLHKDNSFTDSYIEAIDSPHLRIKQYSMMTMRDVLDEFIGYSQLETGPGRYNIVLNKTEKHYLDWASSTYKKSKSQILRELINEKIIRDRSYAKYIKGK
jgi:hypothetical protein